MKEEHFNSKRLRVGDIIVIRGEGEHMVWLVNESRAACVPLTKDNVNYETLMGKTVNYQAARRSISISPESEVKILQRLGREGMLEYLEQQKQQNKETVMKNKDKKSSKSEDNTPKLGRLGGFLGHPITAVIRAMAKAGWSFKEVRALFDKEKIDAADNTIRIQLTAGRSGKQPPAPIPAADLKKLRPELPEEDEKPAKSSKKDKKASKSEKPAKSDKKADKAAKSEKPAKAKKQSKPEPEDEDEGSQQDEAPEAE